MEGRTAVQPEEIIELATQVMQAEGAAVSLAAGQLNNSFVEAANLMLGCQGHILVAGSGTSHPVAARMAHLLSCCGTPALFIHPGDSQHGLAGAVKETDILVAISKGGETAEVITLAKTAKERGAKLIGLTEKPESSLGLLSDIILNVISPPDVDPFGMIATGSSLVNAAFGDALCVVLLKLRGYSLVDFGATHPGGAVGQKLKEIL
jgi:D-arabinose 5-phosphate isomerase GutQ